MTDKNIWERIESDTPRSYEAFCIYRDMGSNRNLRDVAQKLDKSLTVIGRWSSKHDWVNRTSMYDDYQLAQRNERKLQKQIEIEDNVLSDYDFMRKMIQKRIDGYIDLNYQSKPHEIQDLLSLMKQADDYARRAVGLPDRITESSTSAKVDATVTKKPVSADELTDDELAAILASHQSNGD